MIKAYKLFTGADGHSHFETGTICEDCLCNTSGIKFKETEAGSDMNWHPAPTTQYVLTLQGSLEFTVFSGEKFILRAGDILIATDTTGKGHKWKMLGNETWKRACIPFTEAQDVIFLPD